jgi:hypothetical protein
MSRHYDSFFADWARDPVVTALVTRVTTNRNWVEIVIEAAIDRRSSVDHIDIMKKSHASVGTFERIHGGAARQKGH